MRYLLECRLVLQTQANCTVKSSQLFLLSGVAQLVNPTCPADCTRCNAFWWARAVREWETVEREKRRKQHRWQGGENALLEVSRIHLGFLVWEFSNICQKTGIQSQLSQIKSLIQNTKTWATNITHLYLHEGIKSNIWISFTAPTKWNYFKSLEVNVYRKAVT